MTRISLSVIVLGLATYNCHAQSIDKIINVAEVERIEKVLAADEMRGRMTFTPEIDKAADFIAAEFKKAGIQPVKDNSYFQSFTVPVPKMTARATVNGAELAETKVAVLTPESSLTVNQQSGYEKVKIAAGDTIAGIIRKLQTQKKNYLLIVDTSHARIFAALRNSRRPAPASSGNIVAFLGSTDPDTYSVDFKKEIREMPLKNVVGIIPGKSKKEEYVIFSGHYDHIGVGRPTAEGDSIYNGANDDAAGTTAVIMLANYFAKQKNNERTLVFAAFTAEESGGFGARHFSEKFEPAKVMAMFNIEMIGTESKWGTNSAYITGYEKTDMGKILEKNLQGSNFKFYPDPYPAQNLFYRSDNATLARLGVPAHTISTSKMDVEKYYHTPDDEIGTLDMKNMAEIIKAIALSSSSIVSGKDTPSRVDTSELKR
jgi:hypothetical protein